MGGKLTEKVGVDPFKELEAIGGGEGVGDGIEVEMVVVDFSGGAVTGVKVGGDWLNGMDPDVGGEQGIEGGEEFRDGEGGVEVGGLAHGMDARIGSARASEGNGMAKGCL